jgi:hypothetical protein
VPLLDTLGNSPLEEVGRVQLLQYRAMRQLAYDQSWGPWPSAEASSALHAGCLGLLYQAWFDRPGLHAPPP